MPNAFVDTNILVYAAAEIAPIRPKTQVARRLLCERDLCFSVQVLNEFTANARNPNKLDFSRSQEKDWISRWLQFEIAPLTIQTYMTAQEVHLRYGLSHWDALIVASAGEIGCPILYSEDMNHNQDYDGVRVVNPFLPAKQLNTPLT